MNLQPSISVIVAVYNGASTLQRCIDSFINQTHPHRELIIMDGGSNDGTVNILETNTAKIAYWESKPDGGIYHAWNKALTRVKGDWVCFLGADDYFWQSDVLQNMGMHLGEAGFRNIRLVYGQVAVVSDKGEVLHIAGGPSDENNRSILGRMQCIHPQGALYHRGLFEEYGQFDDTFRIAGDVDFSLRFLKVERICFVPNIIVAGYGYGGISSVPANKVRTLEEVARAYRINRVPYSLATWRWHYLKSVAHAFILRSCGKVVANYVADTYRVLTGRAAFWRKV